MAKPVGWMKQPARHALASKGIRTNIPRTMNIKVRWESPRLEWARYADVIDVSGDADDPYLQQDVPMERRDEIGAMAEKIDIKTPPGEWTYSLYDEYLNGIQALEGDLRNEVQEYEEAARRDSWDRERSRINETLPHEINKWLNLNQQQINDLHDDALRFGPDHNTFYLMGYTDGQKLMLNRLKRSGL